MPLHAKLAQSYRDWIYNDYLNQLQLHTPENQQQGITELARLLTAIREKKLSELNSHYSASHTQFPHLYDKLKSLLSYMLEPETMVRQEDNYSHFFSIIENACEEKLDWLKKQFEENSSNQLQKYSLDQIQSALNWLAKNIQDSYPTKEQTKRSIAALVLEFKAKHNTNLLQPIGHFLTEVIFLQPVNIPVIINKINLKQHFDVLVTSVRHTSDKSSHLSMAEWEHLITKQLKATKKQVLDSASEILSREPSKSYSVYPDICMKKIYSAALAQAMNNRAPNSAIYYIDTQWSTLTDLIYLEADPNKDSNFNFALSDTLRLIKSPDILPRLQDRSLKFEEICRLGIKQNQDFDFGLVTMLNAFVPPENTTNIQQQSWLDNALSNALRLNLQGLFKLLINKGANSIQQKELPQQPYTLHLAATCKKSPFFWKEMLQNGFSPNVTDQAGETPLHYVCALADSLHNAHPKNVVNVIDALIVYGAQRDATNQKNQTPLHLLIKRNTSPILSKYNERVIKLFSSCFNIKDNKKGNTPLMLAIMAKDWGLVSLMLLNGADPTIQNYNNESALDKLKISTIDTKLKRQIKKACAPYLTLKRRQSPRIKELNERRKKFKMGS